MEQQKSKLILQIINLCDENEKLKSEIKKLKENKSEKNNESLIDSIKENLMMIGMKETCNYITPFQFPDEIFNSDTRQFIPFESWVINITRGYSYAKLPKDIIDNLGFKDVVELFKPYLKKEYEKFKDVKQSELMYEGKNKNE